MATTIGQAFRQLLKTPRVADGALPAVTTASSSSAAAGGSSGGLYSDGRMYKFIRLHPSSSRAAMTRAVRVLTLINDNPAATNPSVVSRPFQTMMVDKDEITFMVCDEDWKRVETRDGGTETKDVDDETTIDFKTEISPIDYRLITFDVDLAPTLVGFMAFVTEKLATAQVSVLPFGAYSKDHIFVSTRDFDKAMDVLQDAATEAAESES
mmetsp:Transcript_30405/g.73897  ORF Transcript_30405/g.73897 Transcript_30405/m.73897 type:complete len:210 (+) Transcript_30405:57-686(+)|eukprot:CAMPEP_0113474510 /NCGR_PEP_ID=MMETSP0014_2-20120614/18625_1 /TAXON_ID=2857 /ORGANISM="Nitzschia sp." /LENGTH=209 /DNA_ID=CAMNT_0000367367 /DNA_START=72 /DNA_END=701 /DNA_ORIENTATION=+ /assembly_acc=CAM_ASM_000159